MTDVDVIEEVETLPAVRAHEAVIARGEMTVADLVAQAGKIRAVMEAAMKPDVHYGLIPGVNKPTLLKPGAEMLNVLLRLAPSYDSDRVFHDDGHLTVISKCTLTHIPTGYVIAEGEGLCSSRESKYAYRNQKRACPTCGAEAIIKGKEEYGGGWLCWKKADPPGCGAKFPDGAVEIEGQEVGKVDNPDLPDTWNTVLKMADKRALVAAVLNGTGASDVFTQDVEDRGHAEPPAERPFDPGVDLLPGAIKARTAKETVERLTQAMRGINARIDWQELTEQQLPRDVFPRDGVFLRRLSNAVEKITQDTGGADMVDSRVIVEAFAWAFQGHVVEPRLLPDAPSAASGAPRSGGKGKGVVPEPPASQGTGDDDAPLKGETPEPDEQIGF